jgi:hypothetical protein
MFTVKHALQFHQIHPFPELIQGGLNLLPGFNVLFLNGHVEEHVRLFQVIEVLFPVFYQILQLTQLFLSLLGLGLVVPEVGSQGLGLQPLYVKFLAV